MLKDEVRSGKIGQMELEKDPLINIKTNMRMYYVVWSSFIFISELKSMRILILIYIPLSGSEYVIY